MEQSSLAQDATSACPTRERYRVVQDLGGGGMGHVFKAWDSVGGCTVALKMLRRSESVNPRNRKRFEREIELVRCVTHRNVVQVFEWGVHQGLPFFTMEYVEGETLRQRLTRTGRLGAHEAVELMAELADGLCAVHAQGILHRDIKPDNVMIAKDGTAKLMDFGLAVHATPSAATRLTGDGFYVGTVRYLAPEIFEQEEHDARSDVYQLGVLLYEALTGQHPFQGACPVSVVRGEATFTIEPPSKLVRGLSQSLDDLIMSALEQRRENRLQSAERLRDGLWAWLETRSHGLRRYRQYSRPLRIPWVAAAAPSSAQSWNLEGWPWHLARGLAAAAVLCTVLWHTVAAPISVSVSTSTSSEPKMLDSSHSLLACSEYDTDNTYQANDGHNATGTRDASGRHPNVTTTDEQGLGATTAERCPLSATKLHVAAWKGQQHEVSELLSKARRIDATDHLGRTPLHYALRRGHEEIALLLLARGAAVNRADHLGVTPLHEAAGQGCTRAAVRLLAQGAPVNVAGGEGDTPLYWAVCKGHHEVANLLRAAGGRLSGVSD